MALRRRLRRLLRQMQSERIGPRETDLRGPNARTDGWYDSRGERFVDDGRPKR